MAGQPQHEALVEFFFGEGPWLVPFRASNAPSLTH